MAQSARGYSAGKFVLELEDQFAGFLLSVEGGEAFAEVVMEPPGEDKVVRKHPGSVAFSPIVLSFGAGMTKALYRWMGDLLTRKAAAKSGAIVFLDFNYKEQSRLTFDGALITEISFPAVAAASKDAAHITLTIQPEMTRRTTSSGAKVVSVQSKTPKWLANNFQLNIVGLDACKDVNAIDALVIKRPVTRGTREADAEAGTLEIPNLAFRIPERSSADFIDWFDELVVEGGSEKNERNGTLDFLDPSLKAALFSLSFINLGIVAVRRERSVGNSDLMALVNVECYCEEMAFATGEKAVAGADAGDSSSSSSSTPTSAPTAPTMISLSDTLLGIITGRIQGEAAARAALEIARSPETLAPSTATKSELVARRQGTGRSTDRSEARRRRRPRREMGDWSCHAGRAQERRCTRVSRLERVEARRRPHVDRRVSRCRSGADNREWTDRTGTE